MRNVKLSRRYAKALFDLAKEQGLLEPVKQDMDFIHATLVASRDLLSVLNSPIINNDKKIAVLKEIFQGHIQEMSLSFLNILTVKSREAFLDEIANQFRLTYKEYQGIKTAYLKSPIKVDENTKAKLKELIHNSTNQTVELVEEIDPKMLGGFILKYDDKEYDASISTLMKHLKDEFQSNDYIGKY